jgi:hypothetical protein
MKEASWVLAAEEEALLFGAEVVVELEVEALRREGERLEWGGAGGEEVGVGRCEGGREGAAEWEREPMGRLTKDEEDWRWLRLFRPLRLVDEKAWLWWKAVLVLLLVELLWSREL